MSHVAYPAGAYPGFNSIKRPRVFPPLYSPLDGMQVHGRVTPSIKFTSTHSYTWVERDTVRVQWFAKKYNTMSPARTQIRTVHSSVERINHEATHCTTHNDQCFRIIYVNCFCLSFVILFPAFQALTYPFILINYLLAL